MKRILICVPDLMFETQITDVARRLGFEVATAASVDAENIARANLMILGLEKNPEWQHSIEAARGAGVPVLAFARHTSAELLRQARAAGCAQVVVNSDIAARLPELLKEILDAA